MALVRWNNGGRPLPTRHDQINDPECFEDDPRLITQPWSPRWTNRAVPAFTPRVDVITTEQELIVKADLPGLGIDDLDITITNTLLTLRGERHDEDLEKSDCYVCRESSFGTFERTMELPEQVLSDEAQATLKNGVLTLRLPKARPSASIKVEVKE